LAHIGSGYMVGKDLAEMFADGRAPVDHAAVKADDVSLFAEQHGIGRGIARVPGIQQPLIEIANHCFNRRNHCTELGGGLWHGHSSYPILMATTRTNVQRLGSIPLAIALVNLSGAVLNKWRRSKLGSNKA